VAAFFQPADELFDDAPEPIRLFVEGDDTRVAV
jgi:hypothetical protein